MNLQERIADAKELDRLLAVYDDAVQAYKANVAANALPDAMLKSMREMVIARMAVEKNLELQ